MMGNQCEDGFPLQAFDKARGVACDYGVRFDVMGDDGAGADGGIVSDDNAWKND